MAIVIIPGTACFKDSTIMCILVEREMTLVNLNTRKDLNIVITLIPGIKDKRIIRKSKIFQPFLKNLKPLAIKRMTSSAAKKMIIKCDVNQSIAEC